jgi:altronate hydrolase
MPTAFPPELLRLHPDDTVAVALRPLAPGDVLEVDGHVVTVRQAVPGGHKLALAVHAPGDAVLKYGWAIGRASAAIGPGEHVHTHNVRTGLAREESYGFSADNSEPARGRPLDATFDGYLRADGRVGTRNEIWVIPTVGCVARAARRIAERAHGTRPAGVDGVFAFPHPFGCSQLGDDLSRTRKVLASLAAHPNAGGVLIVGLGCENNQLAALLTEAGLPPDRVRSFNAQASDDEVEDGLRAVEALAAVVALDVRTPRPFSDLVIGLKCGGSDGYSGLTANPLVGRIATRLAASGGTPVLTEIPEIFGAETLLMRRAVDREVFDAAGRMVNDFKAYFTNHGQPVSENPSPGNIEGGITTLEEKSLGAVQKAGDAALTQVLAYGERVRGPGLALLEAPGNDAVSSTALTAAGATLILFTTGRGTPLGFPAPTLKIASNSSLAQAKSRWIDFDAGRRLTGVDLETMEAELLGLILATASGQPTRSEQNDERDIALWKGGVTL